MALSKIVTKLGKEINLSPGESTYFKMIADSEADSKELKELVPSFNIKNDSIELDDKDIDAFDSYIEETVRLAQGQGGRLPPRFHSGKLGKSLGSSTKKAEQDKEIKAMTDRLASRGAPAIGASVISEEQMQAALDEGYSEEEIESFLAKPEEQTADPRVQEAKDMGYSDEEIEQYMSGFQQELSPKVEEGVGEEFEAEESPLGFLEEGAFGTEAFETPKQPEFTPEKFASIYESMHQEYATLPVQVAGLVDEGYYKRGLKNSKILADNITAGLKRQGHDVSAVQNTEGLFPTYDIMLNTPEGPQKLDSSVFDSIGNSKYEITGAISMAGAALKGAGKAFPMVGLPGLLVKGAAMIGGSALGAAGGSAADLMMLANATREMDNINSSMIKARMLDAGVADATFGILGTTVVKAGIGTVKLVGWAYDLAVRGNLNGAYKALKDHVGIDDEQAKAIVKEWEQITGKKAPGLSAKSRAIHVIPQTTPGAEDIVGQAGQINPRAGSSIIKSIHDRARDVIKSADNITNDNVGIVVKDELDNYSTTVKDYYGGIKDHAVDAMEESQYIFDYDELALEPLFKKIEGNIQNPAVLENFLRRLDKVRQLGQVKDVDGKVLPEFAPRLRSFEDLLDLRKVVNEFKFNTRISGHGNYEAINEVISNINGEISRAVTKHMPQSDVWLKEWKKANTEYSKMLSLKDNVMYKALTAKGVNVDKVINTLVKDIKSIDGTFMQVMGKLPPKTRAVAEGAVMKKLVANNTVGPEGGIQAIHFTNLQKDLNKVGFTSPESREVKRAISELANVFKNDVNIARATGQISAEKFTSYLTFDPIVRMKFVIANQSFNYFRKLMPTAKGEAAALITKASKVLENPANARAMDDLIKSLPDDPELTSTIKQLAIDYAKFGFEEHYPKVKMFRTGVPGRSHKAIDGKLGKGIYWTTNKAEANKRGAVTGGKIESRKMLPARIASETDIRNVLGRDFDIKELKENPEVINKLKDELYLGLTIGEDTVIFK